MHTWIGPPYNYASRWTAEEEAEAVRCYEAGMKIEKIAERLGRSVKATKVRIYTATGKWGKKHKPT